MRYGYKLSGDDEGSGHLGKGAGGGGETQNMARDICAGVAP